MHHFSLRGKPLTLYTTVSVFKSVTTHEKYWCIPLVLFIIQGVVGEYYSGVSVELIFGFRILNVCFQDKTMKEANFTISVLIHSSIFPSAKNRIIKIRKAL